MNALQYKFYKKITDENNVIHLIFVDMNNNNFFSIFLDGEDEFNKLSYENINPREKENMMFINKIMECFIYKPKSIVFDEYNGVCLPTLTIVQDLSSISALSKKIFITVFIPTIDAINFSRINSTKIYFTERGLKNIKLMDYKDLYGYIYTISKKEDANEERSKK